jgi:hypothetical protein
MQFHQNIETGETTMIVSNEFDGDISDALAEELVTLAHKDEDLTHREVLTAYMGAIGSILSSISCRHCREAAAEVVSSMLPDAIRLALDYAAKRDGSQPPSGGHVH